MSTFEPRIPAAGGWALARWWRWGAPAMLALGALIAYHNTFSAPFIFDDIPAIAQNPTIRDLQRPSELLAPPALRGSSAAGRPMVNLSLALNRALGGNDVRGYHVFNLLVHIGSGWVLFGLVSRVGRLACDGLWPARGKEGSDGPAFLIALLWLVHPLLTESVTCIIQRTESLAGFFYLLIFYSFVRSVEPGAARGWALWVWTACFLGAATKEIVATAPVLLLLFDRTFVAGTFREAWRRRGWLHLRLALTVWVTVGLLIWRSETRGGTVGFGHGASAWEYLLTQCRAIALYLKLSVWPHPLVLDYGTDLVRDPWEVWPQGILILGLLSGTAWALWRRPVLGFLGAWFFVILAPSSSFVPVVTQTMAEHRMYLPLISVVVLVVAGLWEFGTRTAALVALVLAVTLASVTVARNEVYRSVESIWRDTVAKRPNNPRAHYTLAQLADEAGRHDEAIGHGEAAVKLLPSDPTAHFNLAFSLAAAGRREEALVHYREAGRLQPDSVMAQINAGALLAQLGRLEEAMPAYEAVARLKPSSGEDQFNLGQVYMLAGRPADAVVRYEAALKAKVDLPEVHFRLGNALRAAGRPAEAVEAYREAARRQPEGFEARVNLAGTLLLLGKAAEAVPVYEEALRLRADPQVSANLAIAKARAR